MCADFNAYHNEQALQNLYDADYTNLEGPNDYSYQFRSAPAPFCIPLLCLLEKLHSTANSRIRTGQCDCSSPADRDVHWLAAAAPLAPWTTASPAPPCGPRCAHKLAGMASQAAVVYTWSSLCYVSLCDTSMLQTSGRLSKN